MNCCHEHSTKQLKISKIYPKKQLIFKEIFKKLFFVKSSSNIWFLLKKLFLRIVMIIFFLLCIIK